MMEGPGSWKSDSTFIQNIHLPKLTETLVYLHITTYKLLYIIMFLYDASRKLMAE